MLKRNRKRHIKFSLHDTANTFRTDIVHALGTMSIDCQTQPLLRQGPEMILLYSVLLPPRCFLTSVAELGIESIVDGIVPNCISKC
jgi:hypothetical protein